MKVIGQVLITVQHILSQFLCVTVTESCSKYLSGFTMSLREEVEESTGRYVYCMLKCVCVCVCVYKSKRVLSGAESRESADGQRQLPAGSICPRVRHQTFTSNHQLFSTLHCQSVSMPLWQTTKTWVKSEKGIRGHGKEWGVSGGWCEERN